VARPRPAPHGTPGAGPCPPARPGGLRGLTVHSWA
jgi:hypothetical protein